MYESDKLNFYNGGELNYTMNISSNNLPIISLINCDTRNQVFTVRIQIEEKGKKINIDAPINLKHINNWMSKVKKQDEEIYNNYYKVMRAIKEKFRLDNVLSDSEINKVKKEMDDALYKYDITRKEFERKYCGGFEEWHKCGLYDHWGKHDQNSYIELYEKVGDLCHKASILKCKFENECKKRAVKYGWYDVDEDTIDWYGKCW
jgi:parvulin-like peptidyl-prolyl isomerase